MRILIRVVATVLAIAVWLFALLGLLVNELEGWFFAVGIGLPVLGIIIWAAKANVKALKMARQKAREAGADDGVKCQHIDGLGLVKGAPCEVWFFPDRLQINDILAKRTFNLSLNKLRAIEAKTEAEIREVGKNMLGRAMVGHLLVPGLGAIIGGMTGMGTKEKRGPTHHYLVINYIDDTGELRGITFSDDGNLLWLQAFAKRVTVATASMSGGETVNL